MLGDPTKVSGASGMKMAAQLRAIKILIDGLADQLTRLSFEVGDDNRLKGLIRSAGNYMTPAPYSLISAIEEAERQEREEGR